MFVEGLESQEHSGFDDIHRLLKGLPVPVTKAIRLMTHAQAIEAQFLPLAAYGSCDSYSIAATSFSLDASTTLE